MKLHHLLVSIILFGSTYIQADVIFVESQQQFEAAHNSASATDSIIWRTGTYSDIDMTITKDDLSIMAEKLGGTIFTGASKANINGDNIVFQGFQYLDGDIGTSDIIQTRGSHIVIEQINIRAYTSFKYLRVREESQYVTIIHCNFENRLNLDDQNILSILVDENNPGYHKIQYCSFKNFDGTGNDQGIEPIRIGLSTQADHISRTLVEYCYFTQCDGDGELISSKASQNVYRHNTFENNPKAELVLRHGNKALVYGNFFINGKGGVRVREGQDHYIYNNYFYELDDRCIFLQNESSDPLDNINIAFNTIVDCSEFILGRDGNFRPTNVTLANNIFADPDDQLFEEATTNETWIGNIAFGDLGIILPVSGMTVVNPQLIENSEGFFELEANSPAINSAQPGYALLPQFPGIEGIDFDISFDLMSQSRPAAIAQKDLGCNEFPNDIPMEPIATESNTGPSYNTTGSSGVISTSATVNDIFKINSNPTRDQLNLTINGLDYPNVVIDVFNLEGKRVIRELKNSTNSNGLSFSVHLNEIPSGYYIIRATSQNSRTRKQSQQLANFIKSQ